MMDKEERKAILARMREQRKGAKIQYVDPIQARESGSRKKRKDYNWTEDAFIDAYDSKRQFDKLMPILEKLNKGQLDVSGMFGETSAHAAVELLRIALAGDSERNRLDAVKHLLALGGHNPSQKHEISRVDPDTPKAAILSMLEGMKKDLAEAGVEVIDDREDET